MLFWLYITGHPVVTYTYFLIHTNIYSILDRVGTEKVHQLFHVLCPSGATSVINLCVNYIPTYC